MLRARRIQRRNVWLWMQTIPSVWNIVRNSLEPCACPFIRFPKTGTRRRRPGTRLNIPVRSEFSRDLISGLKRVPGRNWYGADRASEGCQKDQNGALSLALHLTSCDNAVPVLPLTWRNMMSRFWVYGVVTALNARIFVSWLPEVPENIDLSSPWWLKLGAKRAVKKLMRSTLFFVLLLGGNFGQRPVSLLLVLLVKFYQTSKITNLRIFVLWQLFERFQPFYLCQYTFYRLTL